MPIIYMRKVLMLSSYLLFDLAEKDSGYDVFITRKQLNELDSKH